MLIRAYSICYRWNINNIYIFYLSYPAIIHCKLTEVRGVLHCSISEHLRQQNTLEWVSVVKDAGIGIFTSAWILHWNEIIVVTCSFHWGKCADQSVPFMIFFCDAKSGALNTQNCVVMGWCLGSYLTLWKIPLTVQNLSVVNCQLLFPAGWWHGQG